MVTFFNALVNVINDMVSGQNLNFDDVIKQHVSGDVFKQLESLSTETAQLRSYLEQKSTNDSILPVIFGSSSDVSTVTQILRNPPVLLHLGHVLDIFGRFFREILAVTHRDIKTRQFMDILGRSLVIETPTIKNIHGEAFYHLNGFNIGVNDIVQRLADISGFNIDYEPVLPEIKELPDGSLSTMPEPDHFKYGRDNK